MTLYEYSAGTFNPHRLEEVLKGSKRAADLVKQILTFSRQSDQQFRPIRINPIIEDSLKLLRSSISTTIEIRHNISFESDIVRADATQINQVLINLCTNAAHAMRESGGILEVDLKNIELDEDASALFQNLAPGKHLRLAVSDTGQGDNQEHLKIRRSFSEGGRSQNHGGESKHGFGIQWRYAKRGPEDGQRRQKLTRTECRDQPALAFEITEQKQRQQEHYMKRVAEYV